jgi:hypothetical protein
LQRARQHYPVSLHGVGLSPAVSGWTTALDQLARLAADSRHGSAITHALRAGSTRGAPFTAPICCPCPTPRRR